MHRRIPVTGWRTIWGRAGLLWMVAAIICIQLYGIAWAPVADDRYFAQMLSRYSLADYLIHRYQTWTGRLPLEAMLVVLVHHPGLWRVFNGLMLVLLCHALGRLAAVGTRLSPALATVLAFVLFLLFSPQVQYESSFWLTGSINYLWPVALGLWSLVPLVEGRRYRWPMRLSCCLSASVAAYCDQLALVLVPLSLGLLFWRMRQGRWHRWDGWQAVLLCANAAFALGAPGNRERFFEERGMRFPNFAMLDLADKVRIGLGLIARAMTNSHNYLVCAVALLAAVLLWRCPIGRGLKTVLLAGLVLLMLQVPLGQLHLQGLQLHAWLPERLDGGAAHEPRFYMASALACVLVAMLVIASALGFWQRWSEVPCMAGVALLGLASLGLLGFSPTAYLSGQRIAFLCLLAWAMIGLRQLDRIGQTHGLRMQATLICLLLALANWRLLVILLY